MLVINNDDVARVLAMADCIRVQEDTFKKLPTGGAMHRPRIDMDMRCDRADGYFRGLHGGRERWVFRDLREVRHYKVAA